MHSTCNSYAFSEPRRDPIDALGYPISNARPDEVAEAYPGLEGQW